LAAAKARGTRLGNPRAAAAVIARAAKNIQAPPPEVLALITGWRDQGRGYRDIARELNRLNIPQGKQWYASTVRAQLSVSKN
jgi:Recombinase